MGQSDVIEYLEKFGEGTVDQMAKYIGTNNSSVSLNVNRLKKYGEVIESSRIKEGIHWVTHWRLKI